MANRYAIIKDNIVENVVLANEDVAQANGWIRCDTGNRGWIYENGSFVEPPLTPAPEPAPAPTKEELLAQLQALQAQIQALT